jgi:hypothetical protein
MGFSGGVFFQILAGAFYGKLLIIKQIFNGKDQLYILSAIHALAGFGSLGFDAGELIFPESQNR